MGFPPNFTNIYDVTFPPDTQLANLLGSDLRNFRTDVMQRMSLLSGQLANRPTPETVNASWGGSGYGLLYFATDTSQVFQWNGSTWLDVTSSVGGPRLFRNTTKVTVTTNSTDGISFSIPANTFQIGSTFEITLIAISTVLPTSAANIILNVGGTIVQSVTPANGVSPQSFKFRVHGWVTTANTLTMLPHVVFNNGSNVIAQTTNIANVAQTFTNNCIVKGASGGAGSGYSYDFDYVQITVNK